MCLVRYQFALLGLSLWGEVKEGFGHRYPTHDLVQLLSTTHTRTHSLAQTPTVSPGGDESETGGADMPKQERAEDEEMAGQKKSDRKLTKQQAKSPPITTTATARKVVNGSYRLPGAREANIRAADSRISVTLEVKPPPCSL